MVSEWQTSDQLMSNLARRIVARLDIKAPNLVKGIQLEGLRVIGDPAARAVQYYRDGIDELLYIDIVASLYERNSLADVVERTASEIFVPLTVGGGIRSLDDIHTLLRAGADKVAINTAAVRRPELIIEASRMFGSQCIVVSIEAKQTGPTAWEAYTDNGRERTNMNALEWARRAIDLGAGELLITSVDREGMRRGVDTALLDALGNVPVPVIACGGVGATAHVVDAFEHGADAIAVASILHYDTETVGSLKRGLSAAGVDVRL